MTRRHPIRIPKAAFAWLAQRGVCPECGSKDIYRPHRRVSKQRDMDAICGDCGLCFGPVCPNVRWFKEVNLK